MSKSKHVSFEDGNCEVSTSKQMDSKALADDVIKKHTLDSDEEDVQVDDKMDEDDIEGEEDETIAFDGSTTITPFNMKEEMETGHFDKTGTYIFDKESEIKDNWMDDIDWVKVKHNAKDAATKEKSDSSDSEPEQLDELGIWKDMVTFMQPGETVAHSLRRLGGGAKKLTSAQRLKAKKLGIKPTAEELKIKESFQSLTSLADSLIQSGYMEIYEDTYEKLMYKIKGKEEPDSKRQLPADEDDALDMFGDEFDEKAAAAATESSSKDTDEPVVKKQKIEESPADKLDDQVRWEYKWENSDSAETHGPYTSSEMQQSVDDEKFPKGVFVRRFGSGAEFYTSRRIDFDLYT